MKSRPRIEPLAASIGIFAIVLIGINARAGLITPVAERFFGAVADRQDFQIPDRVQLTGWLGARIAANASNRLAKIDTARLIEGYKRRPGRQTWDGEHVGKWLHAATLAWVYTGDSVLRAKLDEAGAELCQCQLADGYLGTYLEKDRWTEWDVWAHKYNLLGLVTYMRYTGNLAPKFIARSCVECHGNNGRALPPAVGAPMFQTVMKVGSNANGSPHPTLGSVLQPLSASGPVEGSATISSYTTNTAQYGDATPYSLRKPSYTFSGTTPAFFSARLAPPLVGMGLLEAVSESTIAALADPDDANADGISGRMQTVLDPETGQPRLGRFTSKGGKARLSHQVAAALNTDMGVTTVIFPKFDGETTGGPPELSAADLDLMTRYVALLGVGARRDLTNAQALQREQLFTSAQCVKCHTPTLTTSAYHPMSELRNQTIHPYTYLLLHDLGPGLADNMGEGNATGSEWRTPPRWNIGLTAGVSGGEAYLHDGWARSLEEAILWHGGEAEAAKEAFRTMSAAERAALIKFLKSL